MNINTKQIILLSDYPVVQVLHFLSLSFIVEVLNYIHMYNTVLLSRASAFCHFINNNSPLSAVSRNKHVRTLEISCDVIVDFIAIFRKVVIKIYAHTRSLGTLIIRVFKKKENAYACYIA